MHLSSKRKNLFPIMKMEQNAREITKKMNGIYKQSGSVGIRTLNRPNLALMKCVMQSLYK
jgi:hypothetical protein